LLVFLFYAFWLNLAVHSWHQQKHIWYL
jgi:hypothetical protein